MFCKHNYRYTQGYFFCIKCGKRPDNFQNKNRGKKIGIILSIFIIGIIGYLAYPQMISNQSDSSENKIIDLLDLKKPDKKQSEYKIIDAINDQSKSFLGNFDKNDITISYDNIPEYADVLITRKAIQDSQKRWMQVNPELKIRTVGSDGDIRITWSKDLGEDKDGLIDSYGLMNVELGSIDCQGNWHQYSTNMMSDIMSHEIGHYLGIGHYPDEANLMHGYDDFEGKRIEDLEYKIPKRLERFTSWIDSDQLDIEYANLDSEYNALSNQIKRYPTVIQDQLEYQKATNLVKRANSLVEQMNSISNQINCLGGIR